MGSKTNSKIIQQGAEAIIYLDEKRGEVIKNRVKKSYRIPVLDERIRKLRTRGEGKLLEKASKIIDIPKVNKVDEKTKELHLEFIDGMKLSESLDDFPLEAQKKICRSVGESVGKIHSNDIIHGDLTTSNMILKDERIYLIDFGLGFSSKRVEDKAVDLHVLKQALEARHFKHWEELFRAVEKGYKLSKDFGKVFDQLKKVEKRGRYKH